MNGAQKKKKMGSKKEEIKEKNGNRYARLCGQKLIDEAYEEANSIREEYDQ